MAGLDDNLLIKIFYTGLNQEMKEVIRMKEPKGLENHITAVLRMEYSAFCKVVSDSSQTPKTEQKQTYASASKSSSTYNTNRHGNETSNVTPFKKEATGSGGKLTKKYTNEELDKMRK